MVKTADEIEKEIRTWLRNALAEYRCVSRYGLKVGDITQEEYDSIVRISVYYQDVLDKFTTQKAV